VEFLVAMAEKGHAIAQNNLGFCYHYGYGVPQNKTEAAQLYRLAVDQGYTTAQNNLGYCYHYGCGVPQNNTEMARLYRLAADQGVPAA